MFFSTQFFLTTLEDEKNYFTGDQLRVVEEIEVLPAGDYRVIDGELYRIDYHGLPFIPPPKN